MKLQVGKLYVARIDFMITGMEGSRVRTGDVLMCIDLPTENDPGFLLHKENVYWYYRESDLDSHPKKFFVT